MTLLQVVLCLTFLFLYLLIWGCGMAVDGRLVVIVERITRRWRKP